MGPEPFGTLSKLSDELIVPNLDQEISFFYDPASRKLRKRVEMYPEALQSELNFSRDLQKAKTALLDQIRAERSRR